ncbi:MAG: PfkB family carbohydrate kinase [Planctomycetota bacterium]
MSLLVVGSIAYDNIKTPHGDAMNALGGSAVYFSLAASVFGPVRLVGVVGGDFESKHIDLLKSKSVDTEGLQIIEDGKTFSWTGEYAPNMNDRETLDVQLNVLGDFQPDVPASFRDSPYVFLANAAPATQLSVLDQVQSPKLVVADTMDLWISTARDDLTKLLSRIDGITINDSEALQLTERHNLIEAGPDVLKMGPSFAVVKKGEHGAILFTKDDVIPLPAYPTSTVVDPTGAGDSFAGAMMAWLARHDANDASRLKQAIAVGTVSASYTVEDYGTARIASIGESDSMSRFEEFCNAVRIDS